MSIIDFPQQEILEKLYKEIANNDEEAYKFIIAWQKYCHQVDDTVDEDLECESIVESHFTAFAIYNSNYWMKYKDLLGILIPLITSDYIDSNISTLPNIELLRGNGNLMLKAIAFIQGGWVLLRSVSPQINNLSYTEHHNLQTGEMK